MKLDWKRIIITTAITVAVVLFWSICVVPMIMLRKQTQGDGPEQPTTYTTEDGKHHGCKLDRFTDLFGSDKSWKLTCPDGFVQHNGNYYIEKNLP